MNTGTLVQSIELKKESLKCDKRIFDLIFKKQRTGELINKLS